MLTPVVLGEVALSAVLAHAGNEHLIILALIPTREKSKRRAPGSRDPALAWNTTARTSPVRTLGSRSGSLPGCVYAWLCTSATVEGLARARACWAAGQIGESAHPGQLGVRKGSATDTELGSDASGHRSAPGTRMRHRCSWQDRRRAGFGNTSIGVSGRVLARGDRLGPGDVPRVALPADAPAGSDWLEPHGLVQTDAPVVWQRHARDRGAVTGLRQTQEER